MELSNDVLALLNRCTVMNCIYEGQSFSRKAFSGAFGEPDRSELAVKEMVENGLVVKTPTGAYSLTAIGAAARKSAPATSKKHVSPNAAIGSLVALRRKRYPQSRPPINSLWITKIDEIRMLGLQVNCDLRRQLRFVTFRQKINRRIEHDGRTKAEAKIPP